MKLNLTPNEIIDFVSEDYPEIQQLLFDANLYCHKYKGSIQPYQAASLYYLAKDYNHRNILEIGTGVGYSTFFLASACPQAEIVTINPVRKEIDTAVESLYMFPNVEYEVKTSREWFEETKDYDEHYDFIFIDGDHKDIKFDIQWYNRLNINGLIIFHDYSNSESKSPCLPVWNALTTLTHSYGDFDVKVVDSTNKFGIAGWYK